MATYVMYDSLRNKIERGECVTVKGDGCVFYEFPKETVLHSGCEIVLDESKDRTLHIENNGELPITVSLAQRPEFGKADVKWAPIFDSSAFKTAMQKLEEHNAYVQKVMDRQMLQAMYGDSVAGMGGMVMPTQKALPAPSVETGEMVDVSQVEFSVDPGYWDTLPVGMALTPRQRIQKWADKRGYLVRQMPMADVIMIDAPKFTMRLTYADYLNHAALGDQIDLFLNHIEEASRAKSVEEG